MVQHNIVFCEVLRVLKTIAWAGRISRCCQTCLRTFVYLRAPQLPHLLLSDNRIQAPGKRFNCCQRVLLYFWYDFFWYIHFHQI